MCIYINLTPQIGKLGAMEADEAFKDGLKEVVDWRSKIDILV